MLKSRRPEEARWKCRSSVFDDDPLLCRGDAAARTIADCEKAVEAERQTRANSASSASVDRVFSV